MTMKKIAPLLRACGLGRRKPVSEEWLLSGVCFEVRPGDRLAIIGPSGAGKTVLLRTIAMLDPFEEGTIRFRGRAIHCDAIPSYRSEVVYLHQRPALLERRVDANLEHPYSLGVHRTKRFDRNRIVDLLGGLGRDEAFLEKPSRDLSGGEAQIVALLRAIQLDPAILLLDEPTASLDQGAVRAIEGLIGRWLDEDSEGRAVVWVSHDMEQARRVSTRILAMQAGRLGPEG
jgi:putative ABC transport system ATP-binding protein